MKVLFIANSWEIGGATKSMLQLVTDLQEKGVDVTVLTPNKKGYVNDFCNKNNINVQYLKYSRIAFGMTSNTLKNVLKYLCIPFMAFYSFIINRIAVKTVKKIINIHEFDYVHTNLMRDEIGLLIAKKYGIKHVLHLREYGKLDFNCVYLRPNICRYFEENTDIFIAISKSIKDYFVNKGICEKKIRVIYNGVKTNIPQKLYDSKDTDTIDLVVVGAITPKKGQIQVIEALGKLQDSHIRLHLFGLADGKYQQELNDVICHYHLEQSVIFEGYKEDVYSKLSEYDIGITSSASEAFGRVTIEYMLAKLPVIVSDTGANCELVEENKNGLVYKYGDIDDLASKIKTLAKSFEKRKEIGERAYHFAISGFTNEHNSEAILSLYEEYNKKDSSSNILVITPIYKICGRPDVPRDTECVHDLIKYWKDDVHIKVLVPYYRGIKKLIHFFNKDDILYYHNGYSYDCDGIDVTMIDWQNLVPHQRHKSISKRVKRIIDQRIFGKDFIPNLVIVHVPSASLFSSKIIPDHCKKIAVLHYSDVNYYKEKKEAYIEYLNSHFDRVFCRSVAIYKKFKDYGLKNLDEGIIYSGVPTIDTHNQNHVNKFVDETTKFLYVGKLIERKKLDLLIKALNNCDFDWKLDIIGTGPMIKQYSDLVEQLNLASKVKFWGQKDKSTVFEFMKKADVFCMPSVRETLGLVYIEAMANGCITIGTIGEGIDGIIQNNKNGFLISPSVVELTDLFTRVYHMDMTEKNKMIDSAIKTAAIFNEKDMSGEYLEKIKRWLD